MSKLFIHNYPWLAGNQDLLASLETAILAHGAEVLADCIKLHAFLVGEGGEASYGDCDSTFRILSAEQLKEINSGYCHPKITYGMWHQNHCGDWSHLFCWSDDKEAVERQVQKALLTDPEQTSFHQYLINSRRAVFHIRMWNSVGEEGDKDFREMTRYGDGRDKDHYFAMKFEYGEWGIEQIPNLDFQDPHFYVQNALCQHEQDEVV